MDIYVLNDHFYRDELVDEFDSVIWTERYNDAGEINLQLPAASSFRSLLVEGRFLGTPGSNEVMMIETASVDSGVLTIIGTTLTGFLKNRMLRDSWQPATDSWKLGPDTAGGIANEIVYQMLMSGGYINSGHLLTSALGNFEVIPYLIRGTAPAGATYTAALAYNDVFTGIKTVCDLDNLGFRLRPNLPLDDNGTVIFETYRGRDLTSTQVIYSPVIFEPSLDSLAAVKDLRSIAEYKNVAYVWPSGLTSQSQIVVVYVPGTEALTRFARRSLMVEASDVNAADYTATVLTQVLTQKGRDELANHNYVRLLDGQLVPQIAFTYDVDYTLGDIVELRAPGSLAQAARITEYIRSQDSTGERAYPTLSVIP